VSALAPHEGPFPVVHVLLATYNGERYLRQQWASLEAQEAVELVVHVADDGSVDGTLALARELAGRPAGAIRAVRWLEAPPRRSATRSFLMLLDAALRHDDARWFAFCDQDDVWLPGKLASALAVLHPRAGGDRPALYGGRTIAIDAEGREGGLSPLFRRPPSFRNAIVQNIMGGNTMLMNRPAALLVARASAVDVEWHDWLAYQVVSGADGLVHYDPNPYLHYRQHGRNVMGSNLRWRARWDRLMAMFRGEFRDWNHRNVASLSQPGIALAPANRAVLEAFGRAREAATPWGRLRWLRRSGAFRQKPTEQILLWLACALRRM
jgi:glycosyltransferase involved in cell wall biosynthesis